MDREDVIEFLRMMALFSREDHDYLPQTAEEAEVFVPHEWVIAAVQLAVQGAIEGAAQSNDQA